MWTWTWEPWQIGVTASVGALVVFVMVMRLIRLDREMHKLRQKVARRQMEPEEPVASARTPSDEYHDQVWLPLCQRVAEVASRQMGRGLTEEERRAVWRSRSQLVLEVLVKELAGASAGEAMALLRNAPSGLDRPDPTGWCEGGERV